ncbi:MAG: FprA family A-type flavoprotein [Candidatus Limiplasma sp.]|nr:FprA family A-type flavoprotein [Candidatus Limiplasma sp.]
MDCIQNVTPHIYWVGGSDRRLALFENLFPLDNGVTYNAYVIVDEKTALVDTVDSAIRQQFFENLHAVLGERPLDYLVINHMEPDHCAHIEDICRMWPGVKIVGNQKTFQMIQQFYRLDLEGRTLEVKEGEELPLGRHTLRFSMAPMVHWPEVMFTYETTEHILFSADAFGTFGGFTGNLFSDEGDYQSLYLDETRRYYANIVGKYGPQVLAALEKFRGREIRLICPLHGPVLRGGDIPLLLEKYGRWASYQPEKAGVVLAYASMYGNTEAAVHRLAGLLSLKGVRDLRLYDVSKTHVSFIIARAFQYSHLVLASPTYNMHLYQGMDTLVNDMAELNLQNRGVAIIGNGSWAPVAHTLLQQKLEGMKNMRLVAQPLVIRSAMRPEQEGDLEDIAEKLAACVELASKPQNLA